MIMMIMMMMMMMIVHTHDGALHPLQLIGVRALRGVSNANGVAVVTGWDMTVAEGVMIVRIDQIRPIF